MMRKLFFLSLIFFAGCSDELAQQIPNVYVNEYIYLNNPSAHDINFIGGSIYHQGGYKGLIVSRRFQNGDSNDWVAYEQACPDHYNRTCGSLVIYDDIYLVCPCDSAKFLIFDGTLVEGDAEYPLLQYNVDWTGDKLHITN